MRISWIKKDEENPAPARIDIQTVRSVRVSSLDQNRAEYEKPRIVYKTQLVLLSMQIHFDFSDPRSLLYSERLPGRLNAGQAAALLGFQPHDIPILIRAGFLKPLGGGPRNCVKYFVSASIERHCQDERWLDKAAKAVLRGRSTQARKDSGLSKTEPDLAMN